MMSTLNEERRDAAPLRCLVFLLLSRRKFSLGAFEAGRESRSRLRRTLNGSRALTRRSMLGRLGMSLQVSLNPSLGAAAAVAEEVSCRRDPAPPRLPL